MKATWVAIAMTEGDRLALEKAQKENNGLLRSPLYGQNMQLHYVVIAEDAFRKHYQTISTELLWFAQHYMYHLTQEFNSDQQIADAWTNGYCIANKAVADAVCAEIARENTTTAVMLQDSYFCLVSSMIRKRYPLVLLQQFLHWPWPDIRYWSFLASNITQDIYRGLIGNDIIGFQTERDAGNFLDGASSVLDGAVVNHEEGVILWHGRRTQVRVYPISISVAEARRIANSAEGKREVEKIQSLLGKKIIMRVDRIDPIKNITRGFKAYAQMLDEHPELLDKVTFLAFLVPARESVPVYQDYKVEVLEIISQINRKYGSGDWLPIHAFLGNDRVRALSAMQFYDVLLVNSIFDGMNLVAKEGVAVNQRDGALVLSRTVGAFPQLGKASIPISPMNTTETAQALYKALTLSTEERSTRAKYARQEVERDDLNDWLTKQILDLNKILDR
jgi:trehalose 6-phosphate synthase